METHATAVGGLERLLTIEELAEYLDVPAYEATHDSRGTLATWLGRKAFYSSDGAWLAQRHGDWMAPTVFTPVPALDPIALV